MTVIKKELDLRKRANDIQEELKEVIKKYNKVTSIHNIVMVVLTAIIIVLTIFTLFNKTGRYALVLGNRGIVILDTKTSQLWVRSGNKIVDGGTLENPKSEAMSRDEQEQ